MSLSYSEYLNSESSYIYLLLSRTAPTVRHTAGVRVEMLLSLQLRIQIGVRILKAVIVRRQHDPHLLVSTAVPIYQ